MSIPLYSSIQKLGRAYRHFERLTEIVVILIKFGLGDLTGFLGIDSYIARARRRLPGGNLGAFLTLGRPERLRMALEELGPTFVKFGQVLSSQGDRLPLSYQRELAKLQDNVPPAPQEEIEALLREELEPGLLFDISPTPLAGASIGQVHTARLADGRPVVVKIQRPGVRKQVHTDLEIMADLAAILAQNKPVWLRQDPRSMVEDFSRALMAELDYTREAANMENFRILYKGDSRIKIPQVYREASTGLILTMERLDGIKSDRVKELKAAGYNLQEIAYLGADLLLAQILDFGFFHGDPHPGNIMILPGPTIGLLDLGAVGRLDQTTRDHILDLVLAASRNRPKDLAIALTALTEWDEEPDLRRLEVAASAFMDQYLGRSLKEVDLGQALKELFDLARHNNLSVSMDLLLLARVIGSLEGLGRTLHPNFDLVKYGAPQFKKYYLYRYNPKRIGAEVQDCLRDVLSLAKQAPQDAKTIIRLLKKGKFKLELNLHGLESMWQTIERTSYRIASSLVLAALLISSSLIWHSNLPPRLFGVPVLGLAGYLGAGLMGMWLIYDYLRHRKL